MTAKEALELLETIYDIGGGKPHRIFNGALDFEEQEQVIKTIKQALTPPTEQEVCEALEEYYDTKVYYEEQEYGTSFYLGKVKKDMNGKEYTVKRTIVCSYEGEIGWNVSLPPRLITLIGRFYEGKVKE